MSAEILRCEHVSLHYPRSSVAAVSDLDLVVEPGATIGIVGESGSGKTTLGRMLVGALAPTSGSVLVRGEPWSSVKRSDPRRAKVQMVFQDGVGALNPWITPRQAVAEVLRVWSKLDRRTASQRAEQLLSEAGLRGSAIDRHPRRLSGGQCQRAGIARALACEPDLLVADEPTSSLDVSVQAQILNLLVTLRQSRQLAIVLISHDLSVIRYMCDFTLVMHEGRVVEQGPTMRVLTEPEADYTRTLISSIPGRDHRGSARDVQTAADIAEC